MPAVVPMPRRVKKYPITRPGSAFFLSYIPRPRLSPPRLWTVDPLSDTPTRARTRARIWC